MVLIIDQPFRFLGRLSILETTQKPKPSQRSGDDEQRTEDPLHNYIKYIDNISDV